MSLKIQSSKHVIKRSNISGIVPTSGPSTDHTDNTWSSEDIYPGELFFNQADKLLWIGGIDEVIPIQGIYNTGTTISANTFVGNVFSGGTFYGDGSGLTGITATAVSPYKTQILTSGNYSFTGTINTISVYKSSGSSTTIVLKQSASINDFFVIKDKKGDANINPITISGGTYTIDGSSTYVISTQKESITCLFDGDNYIII